MTSRFVSSGREKEETPQHEADPRCRVWLDAMGVVADAAEFDALVRKEKASLPGDPDQWTYSQIAKTASQFHRHHLTQAQLDRVEELLMAGATTEYGQRLRETKLEYLAELRHMLWVHRPLNDEEILDSEGAIRDWLSAVGCGESLNFHDVLPILREANAALESMDEAMRAVWAVQQVVALSQPGPYQLKKASLEGVALRMAKGEKTPLGALLKRKRIDKSVTLVHIVNRYGRG